MLMQRICGICFVSHHLCGAKVLDDMIGVGANRGDRINADGGEDPPSRPLRADAAISCDGIFLSGRPRDDVRDGRRARAAQPRRPHRGRPRVDAKSDHAAQVGPGGHQDRLRQENARHQLGARRRRQEPKPRRMRPSAERRGGPPVDRRGHRLRTGRSSAVLRLPRRRIEVEVDSFADVPALNMSLVDADGNVDYYHGMLRIVDEDKHVVREFDYHDYLDHFSEAVEEWTLHEVPLPEGPGQGKGLGSGGAARADERHEVALDTARSGGAGALPRVYQRRNEQHDVAYQLGADHRSAPRRGIDRRSCCAIPTCRTRT